MSVPCPVPMLPGGSGKAAAVVLGALVVLAIAARASAQPAQPK